MQDHIQKLIKQHMEKLASEGKAVDTVNQNFNLNEKAASEQ
jgi:hypothetical protein